MSDIVVATYNLMLSTQEPVRFNGQSARVERLPPAIMEMEGRTGPIDLIIVQELMPSKIRSRFIEGMQKMGWLYSTESLSSPPSVEKLQSLKGLKLVNGGVCIFSKHPILRQEQVYFTTSCTDSDCLADKGAVYCCVQKASRLVHVIGTHFQAWDTAEGLKIRQSQAEICREFISQLSLPKDQLLIFGGDLNIDMYTQPTQLQYIRERLSIELCSLTTESSKFSVDPTTNTLVGNDDTSKYKTLLYPKGCELEYNRTGVCTCCQPELLDYIGYGDTYPVTIRYRCYVYPLKAPKEFSSRRSMRQIFRSRDLSDHYPVVCHFELGPPHLQYPNPYRLGSLSNRSVPYHFSIGWVLCIAIVGLLLLLRLKKNWRD